MQGQVLKVSLKTHAVVGVFNVTTPTALGATVWSSPALDSASGTLFFATGNLYASQGNNTTLDDSIVAINTTRMSYVDHYQVPYSLRHVDGDFGASVTLFHDDRGTPLVGDVNKDGIFFALRQANLSAGPVWIANLSSVDTFSSAAFAHGNLYVGSARTISTTGRSIPGALRSINATTGLVNWELRLPGRVFGPVIVAGDLVVVAAGKNLVVARAADGNMLFDFATPAGFYGGPSVAGGRIFVGNLNGTLYDFGLPLAARASADFTSGVHPLRVGFASEAAGGAQGYGFAWDFGDGAHSVQADPSHVYKKTGSFLVTLTISDRAGALATVTLTVNVSAPRVVARRQATPTVEG